MKELLERERELAAVEELLGRRSGVLEIEAGVGIGKTLLIDAACRRAQALGYEVLSARGSELETDFEFRAFRLSSSGNSFFATGQANIDELPDGAFAAFDQTAFAIQGDTLLRWLSWPQTAAAPYFG